MGNIRRLAVGTFAVALVFGALALVRHRDAARPSGTDAHCASPSCGADSTAWQVVATGQLGSTSWKTQIQSRAGEVCVRVETSNLAGVGAGSTCFSKADGPSIDGGLPTTTVGVVDEKGGVLGNVAVTVAGPSVSNVLLTTKSSESPTPTTLSVAGQTVDLPSGAVRVFVQQLPGPLDMRVSAGVDTTR